MSLLVKYHLIKNHSRCDQRDPAIGNDPCDMLPLAARLFAAVARIQPRHRRGLDRARSAYNGMIRLLEKGGGTVALLTP